MERNRSAVGAAWDATVKSFVEDYFERHPAFAAAAGRHEFDGRLADWSPESFADEVASLREDRRRALSFDPATLDEARRFEREVLISVTDADLFWLEEAESYRSNPL